MNDIGPDLVEYRLLVEAQAEIERLGKETAELRAELYWERLTAALRALENKPSVEAPEMCWHTENKPRTDHDEELWEEAFAEGWDRGRSTMRIENERLKPLGIETIRPL